MFLFSVNYQCGQMHSALRVNLPLQQLASIGANIFAIKKFLWWTETLVINMGAMDGVCKAKKARLCGFRRLNTTNTKVRTIM